MTDLLGSAGPSLAKSPVGRQKHPWLFKLRKTIIAWLRNPQLSNEAFLDSFAYQNLTSTTQRSYQKALIHHLLAQKLPVESQALVLLCYIVTTMTAIYALYGWILALLQSELGLSIDGLFSPRKVAFLYGGWAMYTQYVGKYYLNPFGWGEGL